MARASIPISNFSGGERGSLAAGRADVENYNNSLQFCENMIPIVEGPLVKRSGSEHHGLSDQSGAPGVIFIPYEDAIGNNYMLEFVHVKIRIWNASGVLVTTINDGYSADRLSSVRWAQDGDLLVLVDGRQEPKLFSFDGVTPSFDDLNANCGPLNIENTDTDTTIVTSGVSGAITAMLHVDGGVAQDLTLNSGIIGFRTIPQALYDQWVKAGTYSVGTYVWSQSYESSRVNVYKAYSVVSGIAGTRAPGHDLGIESDGDILWEMVHSEYGFARVTNPPFSGNPVELEVVCFPEIPADYTAAFSPAGKGGFRYSLGAWSNNTSANAVTFHEGRLVFGGGETLKPFIDGKAAFGYKNATRIWGSKVDRFGIFSPGIDDNDAYNFQVNSETVVNVVQLFSGKELFINTTGGFFAANGGQGPITPTSINAKRQNAVKAKETIGTSVQNGVVFTQLGGKTVREVLFQESNEQYVSVDISLLSNDIEDLVLNRFTLQETPTPILWTYADTGALIGISYDREYNVMAFHRHDLNGKVLQVQVIPGPDKINDRLWLAIERTVDSVTSIHIESIDISAPAWSDSYISYSGAPTTVITGLGHLEGETVAVMGDNAVFADNVVSGGQITLATEVSEAIVGLPMGSTVTTQRIEGGSQIGTSQGKLKRIHSVIMRLDKTGVGLKIGSNTNNTVDVVMRNNNNNMDESVPLFTGDVYVATNGSNDQEGILHIEHNLPQPCTIVALWPQIEVSDRT